MPRKELYWIFGFAAFLFMTCVAVQAVDVSYETGSIKDILEGGSAYMDKAVQVEGKIIKECPGRGCWFVLDDGTGSLLIDLKPNNFTMPLNLVGSMAKAYGCVSVVKDKKMLTFEPGTPYIIGKKVEITGEFTSPLVVTG